MAYASVASLMRTVELLLTSNSLMQPLICDHKEEFLALRENISSLELFLRNFEKSNNTGRMTDLEARMKEVANVAECTIQLRLTDVVMANDEMQKKKAHERLCESLKQVAEDIDCVQKESTKIKDSSSEKHILVGRDKERERMLAELLGGLSGKLKVIPIVGMGGIGKTTLAESIFNDVRIQSHFDVCAWATVSKEHNAKDILVSLLRSRKQKDDTVYLKDESELAGMLKKSLISRRYLIVLDDMWRNEAWDDVRQCFPSDNKGSRILLTTRNKEVASYAGTENLPVQIGFMDPDESWNLFNSAAFANETLPSDFETIGKKVVDKCQGLPLTIVVAAGLLSKSKRNIKDWENVAKDVMSFVTNDPDKRCLQLLGLSYNHLTSDLKACLLYFGIFPEDSEISVKKLVRLWIAEGFLKLEKDLEGEAEKCLEDLIGRCLVLVSKKSMDETRIKSCKVHDLIYELCLREAQRQSFFTMYDIECCDSDEDTESCCDSDEDTESCCESNPLPPECRLSMHKMWPCKRWTDDGGYHTSNYRALVTPGHHHLKRMQTDDDVNNLLKRIRSIFSFRSDFPYFTLKSELIHFNLLRILDLSPIVIDIFPPEILCLIWLRYLLMSSCSGLFFDTSHIPPEICRLWNLQTFIVERMFIVFPEEIWELMQLRNLRFRKFYLPNPPSVCDNEERYLVLSNIQTISGLSPGCCTKEVISGIRNVKKLKIYGDGAEFESFQESRLFDNLVHLHQLETLSFELVELWNSQDKLSPVTIPNAKVFPATLKKLKLFLTGLRWEDLNIIGELPNLQVLKLIWSACRGEEWNPIEGGFTALKLLLIDGNDLKYWNATDDNFPALERLMIKSCSYLQEIPIEFSNINSLQLIELRCCKPELKASALRIQQEQEELGNKPADVCSYRYADVDDDDDDDDDNDNDNDDDDNDDNDDEDDDHHVFLP